MTGFVTEILGDDRLWDTGLSEVALTGWPLMYETANLAILNRTTDKKVIVRTFNSRPLTGPCGTFPLIQTARITAYSGGEPQTPYSFDSENPVPGLLCIYRPSDVTETANTGMTRQWTNTGMNLTRTQQWSRWQGCSKCGFDQAEVWRGFDSSTQYHMLREGEGLSLKFYESTDSGPNVFMLSVFFKNPNNGATYLWNDVVEPLFMGGATFAAVFNPAGSGEVWEVFRIQAREIGSDEMPKFDFFKICAVDGAAPNAQVVWADSSEATPAIDVKKNCIVTRDGMNRGAVITAPHFRYIMGGEAPYGPNVANGGSIARRGKWSHDMRFENSANVLKLGPGEGLAVSARTGSAYGYSEMVANFAVEQIVVGTFPSADDVRDGEIYGPGGSDYTGNMELPSANDARVGVSYGTTGTEVTGTIALPAVGDVRAGVSYGANGTEATGTLAGGGGGRHTIVTGGWS